MLPRASPSARVRLSRSTELWSWRTGLCRSPSLRCSIDWTRFLGTSLHLMAFVSSYYGESQAYPSAAVLLQCCVSGTSRRRQLVWINVDHIQSDLLDRGQWVTGCVGDGEKNNGGDAVSIFRWKQSELNKSSAWRRKLNRTSGSEPVDLSCNASFWCYYEWEKTCRLPAFLNYVYIFHLLFHFFSRESVYPHK